MSGHDIIVIGASAGGVEALVKVVRGLPADLPAAVFVVLHIPAQSPSLLPAILSRAGRLPAVHPTDDTKIEHGCIYIARPDHHMLIEQDHICVVRGPKENRHRPAVDPTLRSAALTYGPRVIGVILTGALDDGTAGLLAVKRRGGIAVVQDPKDALYPSMPQNAIEYVDVDHIVPLSQIASLLKRLVDEKIAAEAGYPVPQDMNNEVSAAAMDRNASNEHDHIGIPSVYSCPECGGVLWEIQDHSLLRFRCRVGHAFTSETMQAQQDEALEEALWTALKTLEESASLTQRMLQQAYQRGHEQLGRRLEEKLHRTERRIAALMSVFQKKEEDISSETPVQ
jgi:two-component system, chemotaxis family, protein-glutamate methylesterase/glutaminase